MRWIRAAAMAVVLVLGWAAAASAQTANGTYNFSFDLNGQNAGSGVFNVASGVITQITGTLFDEATGQIAGIVSIVPPGTVNLSGNGTSDNLFFPNEPYLSNRGFVVTLADGNFGGTSSDGGGYYYLASIAPGFANQGDDATISIQATPAPAAGGGVLLWLLGCVGCTGVGMWAQRRARRERQALP